MRKIAVISGLVFILSTLIALSNEFMGEWIPAIYTNSTATYTNSGVSAATKKLAGVWFAHEDATTAECTVDVVKGSVTNRVATETVTSTNDVQWIPTGSLWLVHSDKVIVGSDSSVGVVTTVQFEK